MVGHGMRELMLAVVRDAHQPYLGKVLAQVPHDRHPAIRGLFDAHMAALADFCVAGYGGRGVLTEAFIRGLHKALFPPDYRQTVTTPEGVVVTMVPGEYKRFQNAADSHLYPDRSYGFVAPEKVMEHMTRAVAAFNIALSEAAGDRRKRDVILFFALVDFFNIHPFADANGRVAYILADMLAIREGLPAFFLTSVKERDFRGFVCALELARERRDLTPLYEVIERHNPRMRMLGTGCPTYSVIKRHNPAA